MVAMLLRKTMTTERLFQNIQRELIRIITAVTIVLPILQMIVIILTVISLQVVKRKIIKQKSISSAYSGQYHTVKPGQTLYDISMSYYGTSEMVDEIKDRNNIDDDYTIKEGQKYYCLNKKMVSLFSRYCIIFNRFNKGSEIVANKYIRKFRRLKKKVKILHI